MTAAYPNLVIEWQLRHPQSAQDQLAIIAKGVMRDLRADTPAVFRVGAGQTGYLRQLQLGFRVIADPHGQVQRVKSALVTLRLKRKSNKP